jgi:preprotein translocase subunit Sec63
MFPLLSYELFLGPPKAVLRHFVAKKSVDSLQIAFHRVFVFNCHRVAISVNKNIILDFWMPVSILIQNLNSSTIGASVTNFWFNLGGEL